jgi:hypothetical protein
MVIVPNAVSNRKTLLEFMFGCSFSFLLGRNFRSALLMFARDLDYKE